MKLNKIFGILALAGIFMVPATAVAFVDATAKDTGFDIGAFAAGFKGIEDPTTTGLVDSTINLINALLVLVAIAAISFIIIGGVRYITAQGDEDALAQAKNTVTFAIIGIIIVLLAAVIANFFTAQITTLSNQEIKGKPNAQYFIRLLKCPQLCEILSYCSDHNCQCRHVNSLFS